jgi:hypothetical protein
MVTDNENERKENNNSTTARRCDRSGNVNDDYHTNVMGVLEEGRQYVSLAKDDEGREA